MAKKSAKWKPTLTAAKKHILAQGEVIYASNLLHDRFFHLFNIALSLERPDEFGAETRFLNHALALWHVMQSDSQQRKMAITAIWTVPTKLTHVLPIIERLEWAKLRTDKLAEYRNLVAHNTIMFSGHPKGRGRVIFLPSFGGRSTKPAHRPRLKDISLGFWATLRTDLLHLSDYVEALNQQLLRRVYETKGGEYVGVPKTLPGKPRLKSLRLIRQLEETHSKGNAPKRHGQRRPSRGSP